VFPPEYGTTHEVLKLIHDVKCSSAACSFGNGPHLRIRLGLHCGLKRHPSQGRHWPQLRQASADCMKLAGPPIPLTCQAYSPLISDNLTQLCCLLQDPDKVAFPLFYCPHPTIPPSFAVVFFQLSYVTSNSMETSIMRLPSFGHKNPKVPLEAYRPPSYLVPALKERKTRMSKPKTRSGCKTCK
jgi:hypothetical protein